LSEVKNEKLKQVLSKYFFDHIYNNPGLGERCCTTLHDDEGFTKFIIHGNLECHLSKKDIEAIVLSGRI
jgi:hypothetical protein